MDFLDPKKRKQHTLILTAGYVLIGIALMMATTIFIYQAYGFGLDRHGKVIQNGLVFISTRPGPADIYINGARSKSVTNTRLVMAAGSYTFELKRDGYRPWKRAITVEGNSVEHFDYPFLFPSNFTSSVVKKYAVAPGMLTQSLDRHWLLVQPADAVNSFEEYDLTAPRNPPKIFIVPETIFTGGTTTQSWQLTEWAADNRHAVLKRQFQKSAQTGSEYILLDRQDPAASVNLTTLLGFNPTTLQLRNKAYDQYYAFDQAAGTVFTASLKESTPQLLIQHVLAFQAHGNNLILYATDLGAPAGKAFIKMLQGSDTYTIRQVAVGGPYIMDFAHYNGKWYVAAGVQSENRVYMYKDPVGALKAKPHEALVPAFIFKLEGATYVSFSDSARFAAVQNGTRFAVYDLENDKGYAYQLTAPIDGPKAHATWLDGDHLMYASAGKLLTFDFDGANQQLLVTMNPAFTPVFDRDYRTLYSFASPTEANGSPQSGMTLNSTSLVLP